jgi:Fe-S-cluster containining protein
MRCLGPEKQRQEDFAPFPEAAVVYHTGRSVVITRAAPHPSEDDAREIVDASEHPNLRDCSPIEKETFFDRTAATPCPNLSDAGECLIYDRRPLVCRTFGLPHRDGERYAGDI